MSMDAHPSLPQGYKDHPTNFRNPYLSQPAFHPLNPNGIYLGSTVSQNLSYGPMYQGFFPNHPGSQVGYQNPPSFMFRERKGRVNWRNIASLDVDEMIGKGDIRMLESYLSNICFANLEKEDIEVFEDVNLLKLFRLSQYGLEYLLNCQNYLANQAQALEYQYKISDEQIHPLEEQARRNHEEIMRLKNEIGEKKSLLSSYHNTLSTPIYKCHLCTKLFKSQEFLNKHFQTRHESALAKEKKNDHDAILEAQKQNAFLIEKLMLQLKENEDLKLSQMTSALQNRLQEVVQSNKELTAKVAEMEKKMESEATSPDQPFNRTIRRENPQIQTGESLNEIQSRQTPKKPVAFDRNGSPSKQAFHAGDLLQDDETKTHDRQTFKAGSLKDVEDEEKHKKQAFKAGSLKDLEDEEEGEIRQIDSIGKLSSKKRVTRQVFRSGDLEDSDDTEDKRNSNKVSEKQAFKAGSLQDLDDEEPKSHNVQNITNSRGKQAFKRQTFFSGDLENEQVPKNIQNFNAGTLENDQDEVKSRKRSQEDFVIVEEQEEEEAFEHKKDRKKSQEQKHRPTEEADVDEDEIREQHKNAVMKAKNLIKNKYRHPITKEEYENAEKEVSKDLKKKSKQILEVKYKKIEEQDLEDLSNMQKKLKNLNKKDMKHFEEIEQEYQYISSQPMQKPTGKERYDQEVKAESPRNKNKLAQSSELMNLIVDSERKGKGGKTSIEAAAKKKQIFESQSLENQLASVEDIKKSRNQGHSNAQSVRESGTNLLKKSIQYRDPEDL